MEVQLVMLAIAILILGCFSSSVSGARAVPAAFNRSIFPADFVFGASSAAYQYEGAAFEGGKGQSIWDHFAHTYPEKITDRSNGDLANDFYHSYKEDVKLMKYLGLDAFRFSISWPRVLPTGKLSGGKNKEGIDFYNNLINELIANGIKPFVTIFHWDVPLALEQEYGGWLSPRMRDDYIDFVELCFQEFGDRVKYWITMNEPYIFISGGYDSATTAPGRCSSWRNFNCPAGNSATEPYVVGHNLLLAHASAVKLYKHKYQAKQKGKIGITLLSHWMVPYSSSRADKKAAQRALDFMYGWFIDPIVYGEYPGIMQLLVGKRLPKFTVEEANLLKGSFDFIGLNYYTSNYAAPAFFSIINNVSSGTDNQVNLTTFRNGIPIGDPTGVGTFFVYPRGLHDLLVYTKDKYNNPPIYITENGMGDYNNMTAREGVKDPQRAAFYEGHIRAVQDVIKMGGNVKGFFAWSFLDTYEWNSGYTLRFGLYFVDYKNGLKRYPKNSALWYKRFLLKIDERFVTLYNKQVNNRQANMWCRLSAHFSSFFIKKN